MNSHLDFTKSFPIVIGKSEKYSFIKVQILDSDTSFDLVAVEKITVF